MTDNVIHLRDYKTKAEQQPDTTPSDYTAPPWHPPGTADQNGVPVADEGDCA